MPSSGAMSDSELSGNPTYVLATCFAHGFGVKKDLRNMLDCLNSFDDPTDSSAQEFVQDHKERISLALSIGDTIIDESLDDNEWFSRSIFQYQRAARERYTRSIHYIKLGQHDRPCKPQELHTILHELPIDECKNLQVILKDEIFTHPCLHYAVLTSNFPLMRNLVSRGYLIDSLDSEDRTALFEACSIGSTEAVSFLLENGASARLVEDTGVSPLHLSVFTEPDAIHDTIAKLIARGANIYAMTRGEFAWALPWHGIWLKGTPLHFAVSCRNVAAVKALLHFGAEPNQRFRFTSPLDLAASLNTPEICNLLIEHGATTNKHWYGGRSPLHWIGEPLCCSPLGKVRDCMTHGVSRYDHKN
jgi:hypothetical protein